MQNTLSNFIQQKTFSETKNTTTDKIIAYVTSSDKRENTCEILLKNENGIPERRKDVDVDLRNHGLWFPREGDLVICEMIGKEACVISKYTENFRVDILKERRLDEIDISPDPDRTSNGSIWD